MSLPERQICFSLDEVANTAADLMRIPEDLRTHTVEDVDDRPIDMVADQLIARAFGDE